MMAKQKTAETFSGLGSKRSIKLSKNSVRRRLTSHTNIQFNHAHGGKWRELKQVRVKVTNTTNYMPKQNLPLSAKTFKTAAV
jgi:uncharacterized membrane protein YecN with MAPEG domain